MKEYKRFIAQLPLCRNSSLGDSTDESTYIAVQTRLMLIRKYVSAGKSNPVYIENILRETKSKFPDKTEYIDKLQNQFTQIYKQSFEQVLSDGTKLNLYRSMEDVIYGLYLHADEDKILRLSFSNQHMRFHCIKKYVEDVEAILLEIDEFLIKHKIFSIDEKSHAKAPVIHLAGSDSLSQEIRQSPYWSNMYGHDAKDEDIKRIFEGVTSEEFQILLYAILFFEELAKTEISVARMRDIVYEPKIEEWGNFSEAASFYRQIPHMGINNRIRFNEQNDTAYVYLNPNVESAFVISSPHIVADVYELSFIKNSENIWRIFSFGGHIDPFIDR